MSTTDSKGLGKMKLEAVKVVPKFLQAKVADEDKLLELKRKLEEEDDDGIPVGASIVFEDAEAKEEYTKQKAKGQASPANASHVTEIPPPKPQMTEQEILQKQHDEERLKKSLLAESKFGTLDPDSVVLFASPKTGESVKATTESKGNAKSKKRKAEQQLAKPAIKKGPQLSFDFDE